MPCVSTIFPDIAQHVEQAKSVRRFEANRLNVSTILCEPSYFIELVYVPLDISSPARVLPFCLGRKLKAGAVTEFATERPGRIRHRVSIAKSSHW